MADFNKILGQLMGSGAAGGFAGGLAGSVAGNMLSGKKGKKMAKGAMKMGGIAAVGALAFGAYKKYNENKQVGHNAPSAQVPHQPANPFDTNRQAPAENQSVPLQAAPLQPASTNSPFMPAEDDTAGQENLSNILVRAMIAAARADGVLDAKESQVIFQRIQSLDISDEERNILIGEMGKPVNMDEIVNSATCEEMAAEIYIVSLLAIDVDTIEEQSYLAMLAARLKLPAQLVQELHAQVEGQMV